MWDWLPNPDPILKETGDDISVYEELESDAHLSAVINQRKSGVTDLLWEVDKGKSQARVHKAIQKMFELLDINKIVDEILDDFKWGYQPLEIMWAKPQNGLVYPANVVGKPPEWFIFDSDNNLRFRSRENPTLGEIVPRRKFLLSQYIGRYKSPYGIALLGRCFWPITFKKGGFKFWVAFTEKYGMPFGIGKVPRGASETEYDTMADNLYNMIQDAIAVIPDDASFEFQQSDVSGSADTFHKLLEFCNMEISKAIVGQTLTTESGSRGARSLGETHLKVEEKIITSDKRRVEAVFNTLIKYIAEINFGEAIPLPEFRMYPEEEIDKTLAERDKLLADTGQVQFTQQYIEKAHKFDTGDVIVKEAEKEEMEKPGEDKKKEKEKKADGGKFAEAVFKDQLAIDRLVDSLSNEDLNKQTAFVEPVFKLANKVESFKQFRDGLIKIFPDVRPVEVEKKLRNFLFAAEMWGNLTGEDT